MVFRLMIITWFLFHVPMKWSGRNAARAITLTLGKEQLWGYLLVVLDYTTRTKSCRFCDSAKAMGKQPKAHDCRNNHEASSKAMEPAAAVELFNRAPDQSVKFSVYTGDDDSTTEAHIREKVTYEVEKNSDIIHMKRSLTTRLYNLSQNEKFDNCSPLSQKVINYLVKCFSYCYCSKQRRFKRDPGCY